MNRTPPRLATLLLEIFAPRDGRDEILGDLNERFLDVVQNQDLSRARRWYWAKRCALARDSPSNFYEKPGPTGIRQWQGVQKWHKDQAGN